MKLSTFVLFLVIVAGVFYIFAQMVNESNSLYDVNIDSSAWNNSYDYTNSLNDSVYQIQHNFEIIESDAAWYTKIAAGVVGIPFAVIKMPFAMLGALTSGGKIISLFMTTLGIYAQLIIFTIIALIIWGIFKLVEIFQRTPV